MDAKDESFNFFSSLDVMMGSTKLDGGLYLQQFASQVNISDVEKLKIPTKLYETEIVPETVSSYFSYMSHLVTKPTK